MSNVISGSLAGKLPDGSETRLCEACQKKIASLNNAGQKEVAKELWEEISKAGRCQHIKP